MAGVAATCALVTLLVAAVVALPNTLLEDTKQVVLESEPIISKVKRAQEVMMFGNQQNRPSTENKLYPSAHKRASNKQEKDEELPTALPIAISSTSKTWENGNKLAHHEQHGNGGKTNARGNINYPGGQRPQYRQELGNGDMADQQEDHGRGKTVSQYEKGYQYGVGKAALDKHVENALLKSELYGDPGSVNQYRYYGGSSERKRNQHLSYPPPSKRSYQPEMPFVLPTDDLTSSRSRLKRDLGLDPEDVLTVLSLWEAEHRAKAESNPGLDPSWFTYYGLDTAEPFRDDEDEGEEDEEDTSPIDGGWLEGPVAHPSSTPHRYRLERRGGYYYPMLTSPQQYPLYPAQKRDSSQWGGFAKDKRFMVSRKRQSLI
ncbi:prohormone-2-like isoform X2 [Periplaneta americana]|uniref:prohormone-2-like isoform X2 n=1 Tax=Periplaneta americana TaxID=6978 RepID=UPI0037E92587